MIKRWRRKANRFDQHALPLRQAMAVHCVVAMIVAFGQWDAAQRRGWNMVSMAWCPVRQLDVDAYIAEFIAAHRSLTHFRYVERTYAA